MKTKNVTLSIFALVVTAELFSQIFGWSTIHMIVKPILMPSLAAYFFFSVEKKDKRAFLVIIALLLSWIGDVMLLFQDINPIYFMLGLVSFLLAHVTYILIFSKSSEGF